MATPPLTPDLTTLVDQLARLNKESLVIVLRHVLQFLDEPEAAIRSLLYQIQRQSEL